ncbi:MAG TPA: OB-fold domain-containing protein [Jatrophihabitans sp.]|nr:OB-fold domain-containing protein [Jatrophihabitans sp.]
MTPVSVEPALFASLDPPRLAGARCRTCGTVTFPVQTGCAKCTGSDLVPIELPDRGTLWTWTVQAFEPKPPYRVPEAGFTPYGVGYVDLGEVIVESRLAGDPAGLEIGMPMRLTLLPMWVSEDGADVVTYAFERVDS